MFARGVTDADSRALVIESSPASLRMPNLLVVRCSGVTVVLWNRIGLELKETRLYNIRLELADMIYE